jgi:hypothetical protein
MANAREYRLTGSIGDALHSAQLTFAIETLQLLDELEVAVKRGDSKTALDRIAELRGEVTPLAGLTAFLAAGKVDQALEIIGELKRIGAA